MGQVLYVLASDPNIVVAPENKVPKLEIGSVGCLVTELQVRTSDPFRQP